MIGDSRDGAGIADARRSFATSWAVTVAGTSFVGWGFGELAEYLLGLTNRLVDLMQSAEADPATAHALGADLVAVHFTAPETLSRSLAVLGEGLPALVADPRPPDLAQRLARAIGALAGGYATALRDRTLEEQDEIRRAMVVASRESEQKLAASEARFRAMFTEAAIGIGIGDLEGNILEVNASLRRMFGYTAEEFHRRNVIDMVHPLDATSIWDAYKRLIAGQDDHFRVEKRFYRADGEVIWTHLAVSLVRGESGEPAYQVAMLQDITERHRLQCDLEHLAYHDPLTGLPNRAVLSERLAEVFANPAEDRRIALCFVDLDGFKAVNDSLGHDVGDQLLVAVAARLAGCCRPGHLVGRMGGDEFVVLLQDPTTEDEAVAVAEDILAALEAPIRLGDHEVIVTASIGIVEQPVAATSPADLMSAADITLYWAKGAGRNRYALFERVRTEKEIARFTLASAMQAAIERGEFFVDYQPLVALSDGRMLGVEALVRWRHPTYGDLPPDQFIGLAEETGAIVALGRWVLSTACWQARRWRDQFGDVAPFVSVNLAPRQLQEDMLLSDVSAILDQTGLETDQLQFELTEIAVMRDEVGALRTLSTLDKMGVRIAIDDFGTGYSNLSYLRQLPVHVLKLDRSFVEGLTGSDGADPHDELIVSTLITLAHALELTVTAEGIETHAQLERLRSMGCDAGQGWFLARPCTPEDITALLSRGD
ncbi:MAG: hypothetical protein QOG20_3168 [Pseudonocardiales bacterium]|nr:hypothetical protein [Pseudonocardiales bacterium]